MLGNANERAWETQKKALYTRFSQALPLLPSLNGYGQLEEIKNRDDTEILDTAAETFVRDGLSKVMKITNICDSEHFADCGLPDKIITLMDASTVNLSEIKSLGDFNSAFKVEQISEWGEVNNQIDTKAIAFETVNGESILTYYNPYCITQNPEPSSSHRDYAQPKMCANFVYDLNGKKGPNTVGKDIGVITSFYSTDPVVVAPIAYPSNIPEDVTFSEANAKCKEMDENAKLPNSDELASFYCNYKLFGGMVNGTYWSSTTAANDKVWTQGNGGGRTPSIKSLTKKVRCIKR